MGKGLLKDFFCQLCAIQFGKKAVFDMHLSLDVQPFVEIVVLCLIKLGT